MTHPDWHRIRNATFSVRRLLLPGYDMDEVNAFLRGAAERAAAGMPPIDPTNPPRFSATRLREGYDAREVDRFLDTLY